MILGITGKKNSGKNMTGVAIQALMLDNSIDQTYHLVKRSIDEGWTDLLESEWNIKSFAYKVKEVASILTGYPIHKFEDRDFKNSYDETWGMTRREMLQKIGTDCMRNNLHEETWIKALFADYRPNVKTERPHLNDVRWDWPKWIVVDVRFPNESKAIQDRDGVVVKLLRNIDSDDNHLSEKSVEDIQADYTIDNRDISIRENIVKVKEFFSWMDLL